MDLRICRICLTVEARGYTYDRFQLKSYYEQVLVRTVNDEDGLPHYFCYECATMLHKFHKFKEKCYAGQKVLKGILWRGPITYEAVFNVDKTDYGLQSSLSISNVNSTVEEYSYKELEEIEIDIKPDVIEGVIEDEIGVDLDDAYTDDEGNDPEEDPMDVNKIKIEDHDVSELKRTADTNDKIVVKKETEVEKTAVKKKAVTGEKKKKIKRYNNDGEETDQKGVILGSNHWQVIDLNEEEAVTAFRARAEDKTYLKAAYKCTDCFKGFATEKGLRQHNKLRHSEYSGKFECRFCHVRFKRDPYLKRHMKRHFEKYKCLRCTMVFEFAYAAFDHNQYHSGVVKKCGYCDQEFRHTSSYYSHLRTHRSEVVCTLCGVSFVTRAGLIQHQRLTHAVEDVEIEDDHEEVDTFCKRCDIRFETRKAYNEHLFHSAMHADHVTKPVKNDKINDKKKTNVKKETTVKGKKRKVKYCNNDGEKSKLRRLLESNHRKVIDLNEEEAITEIVDDDEEVNTFHSAVHADHVTKPVTNDKIDDKKKTKVKKETTEKGKKKKLKYYNNDGEKTNLKGLLLASNHWKVIELNEEEAITAFSAKAEDKKYLKAAYKCADCFKGFSTEIILKRHNKLRHCESLGKFECRFCHMRFKWDCFMKRHMRQHFVKYKCLRCSLVCDVEYNALLHDRYHSGVVKKCEHCDQEFRHSSTYYTHLRKHRSEFVCTLCGASFVSGSGLHQHQRVTHAVESVEIDDDDEEVNTFCKRCDIRFETRKAYKEHLIHSAMHSEDLMEGIDDVETTPSEVLENEMDSKITNEEPDVQKPKSKDTQLNPAYKKKQWGLATKAKKIPTTCYQCGKSFDTQIACKKHHFTEHPRTPFHTPTERHICEICGVSLAPGSVAAHLNIHTKEETYTCPTCGRQFSAKIRYKRHLLTHTGERPFGCSLCDKRFIQKDSLNYHYRTFHLKEPYRKRNRRKKKTDIEEPVFGNDDISDDKSYDSLT